MNASSPIRRALLEAIGAMPLRLFLRPAPVEAVASAAALVVIVCAAHEREAVLPALRAIGLDPERATWLAPDALTSLPAAANYLVFGEPLARALGAELPTAQQQAARIVVAAAPAQWRDAAAKRRLWQVLKPLARSLRKR